MRESVYKTDKAAQQTAEGNKSVCRPQIKLLYVVFLMLFHFLTHTASMDRRTLLEIGRRNT